MTSSLRWIEKEFFLQDWTNSNRQIISFCQLSDEWTQKRYYLLKDKERKKRIQGHVSMIKLHNFVTKCLLLYQVESDVEIKFTSFDFQRKTLTWSEKDGLLHEIWSSWMLLMLRLWNLLSSSLYRFNLLFYPKTFLLFLELSNFSKIVDYFVIMSLLLQSEWMNKILCEQNRKPSDDLPIRKRSNTVYW